MTAESTLKPGTVVGERYRIERHIGRGGMGSVYEAANTLTEKRVALKLITPEQKANLEVQRRLMREARIAARVQHPNVVDIYDVGTEGDAVFLVMELLHGEPLDDWLETHDPVPVLELMEVFLQMLRGLAALHDAGVTHRDLKPGNLFVVQSEHEPRPRAKLLDFGIARDRSSQTLTLTQPGQILGTPAYMAPEQLDDPDSVDARTDIYACGVVLYEALAGERPFRSDSLTSLIAMVLKGNPDPLDQIRPDIPKDLVRAIERAMSVDPAARFPDVASLAAVLAPFGPKDAWVPTAPPPPSEPSQSSQKLTLAVALTALVVVIAVLATMDFGTEPEEVDAIELPPAAQSTPPPREEPLAPETIVPEPLAEPLAPVDPVEPVPVGVAPDEPAIEGEPAPPRLRRRPVARRPVRPPPPPPSAAGDGLQLDPSDF